MTNLMFKHDLSQNNIPIHSRKQESSTIITRHNVSCWHPDPDKNKKGPVLTQGPEAHIGIECLFFDDPFCRGDPVRVGECQHIHTTAEHGCIDAGSRVMAQ